MGSDWVVLKFGGTSVSSLENWKTIADIVTARDKEGLRTLVVCSALAGISDAIEKLLCEAVLGKYEKTLELITHRHKTLAKSLGASFDESKTYLDELAKLVRGISILGEVSPRVRAQALAFGELLSTKLGASYLKANGFSVEWLDARKYLLAEDLKGVNEETLFLSARCNFERDENCRREFDKIPAKTIVTQGFIARDSGGNTVLLGRGGSDVSASYFAAKLGAVRCEIWTDVPGMYTANPRSVPSARLLKTLDYKEAQEIATLGAKVLHPRCLRPAAVYNIPLHIMCLSRPDIEGTLISPGADRTGPQIKAVSMRKKITLISMESVEMWHQVGFLAKIFDCFRRHGLSIDLISTSETNVTVTLDQMENLLSPQDIENLIEELNEFCQPSVVDSCASISLVGRNIRAILHQITPALEVFEEQKIYMVSQAANDLNLTFVVDEDQVERLVRKIHDEIFLQDRKDKHLGPSWSDVFEKADEKKYTRAGWWYCKKDELIRLAEKKSPLYVYDGELIRSKITELISMKGVDRVFYSVKANSHADILSIVHKNGVGFECVSQGELEHVISLFPKSDPKEILFTPNFVPRAEYERAFEIGVNVTLDNIYPLENWPDVFKNREIFVRIDPGQGLGHHRYVYTAGSKSKFGVSPSEIEKLKTLVKKTRARVVGLHAHVGSNIFKPNTWSDTASFLADIAKDFPDVGVIDVGGGLGVVEKPGRPPLDLKEVNSNFLKAKERNPKIEIWIEPGRYIAAEAGVLLARVTQTKRKGDYFYVGINAGMNALIRPALYGAYHEIVNLSRIDDEDYVEANIVGPICESGDILGYSRYIAMPKDGDVILIGTAGAYGKAMSSNYNMRGEVPEIVLERRGRLDA